MNNEFGNQREDIPDSGWTSPDKNIIYAIRNGDKKVFRQLFEDYYNPMLRFAFRYVKSEVVAEGIVQNIFLWIWENRKTWKVEEKLKTYLFRAVKYKAVDHLRHQQVREDYLDRLSETNEPVFDSETPFEFEEGESTFALLAQQAIEELPERPRMVYKLSRLEGLTYGEIAEILGVSSKTVETHMSRALKTLRKRLEKYLTTLIFCGFIV